MSAVKNLKKKENEAQNIWEEIKYKLPEYSAGFPGDSVVKKNPPANARDPRDAG